MPKRLNASRLSTELISTLDQLATGDPVEIERPGGSVRIVRDTSTKRLSELTPHPRTINGNPDDLANLSWEQAWKPSL